jgi:hypothetical protein
MQKNLEFADKSEKLEYAKIPHTSKKFKQA